MTVRRVYLLFIPVVVAGVIFLWPCHKKFNTSSIHAQSFGDIEVRRPVEELATAIVFVGEADRHVRSTEKALTMLTDKGVTTFIVDADDYFGNIVGAADCRFIGGDIERLGQSLQSSLGIQKFSPPILIGIGKGATIAFIARLQNPQHFPGTVAAGLCAEIPKSLPICETELLKVVNKTRVVATNGANNSANSLTHFLLSPATTSNCPSFSEASPMPRGITVMSPTTSAPKLVKEILAHLEKSDADSSEMPVLELPVTSEHSSHLAVFISGDGGWAGIDEDTGKYLRAHGVNVLGVSSLQYFWSKKTPEQVTAEVERLFTKYEKLWGVDRLLLVGYSLGGEVTPLIYNRLPEELKSKVELVVMIGPEYKTDLQVHITDWLGMAPSEDGILLRPEVDKVPAQKLLCIIGADDDPGVCSELDPSKSDVVSLPGNHHFNGDYSKVADTILTRVTRNVTDR